MDHHRYPDRSNAGELLAARLEHYADRADCVVLGLARGGVPVALEVARRLRLELDVLVVRKIGLPSHPELALGAVASGGAITWNSDLLAAVGLSKDDLNELADSARRQVARREVSLRPGKGPLRLRGRTAILVDDGLATGATMLAAIQAARDAGAARVVVAVPVGSPDTILRVSAKADEVVCPRRPSQMRCVGEWYESFDQVEDAEVRSCLDAAIQDDTRTAAHSGGSGSLEITIPLGKTFLRGTLLRPLQPKGLVIVAHGSGSSRTSERNLVVATSLQEAGFAILLFDLLTEAEADRDEHTREFRFDIELISQRLVEVIDHMIRNTATSGLPIGCFGASTGAAAALVAASRRPDVVEAVVSRGGRPDLAGETLDAVRCPTLLIVGERDEDVLTLNRAAAARMRAPVEISIVPRATHLFPELGALELVARMTVAYFEANLGVRTSAHGSHEVENPNGE